MSLIQKIQNFISKSPKTIHPSRGSVPISKWKGHAFIEIKGSETSRGEAFVIRKVSFSSLLSNIFDSNRGMKIKIKGTNDNTKTIKTTDYYIHIDQIVKLCGLSKESVKELKEQGKLEKLMSIALKMHEIYGDSTQALAKLKNISDKQKHIDLIFCRFKTFNVSNSDLTQVKKDLESILALSDEELAKIEFLSKYVPLENIDKLLQQAADQTERIKLLNTFYNASETLKSHHGFPKEQNIYQKGNKATDQGKQCYSFTLSTDGHFIIALKGELDHGIMSKIKKTYNVTNLEDKLVQRVIRGQDIIDSFIEAEENLQKIYKAKNPYIQKVSKISAFSKGKLKDAKGKGVVGSEETPKFVCFEREMEGNGKKVKNDQFSLMFQFFHDVAKGLAFLHSKNMVHGDIKLENCLIKDGRALIGDLATVETIETPTYSGTPIYHPPEIQYPKLVWPAKRATDIYAFGFMIMEMLFKVEDEEQNYDQNDVLSDLIKENNTKKVKNYFDEKRKLIKSSPDIPDHQKNSIIEAINIAEKLLSFNPQERKIGKNLNKTMAEVAKIFAGFSSVIASDPVF